MSTFGTTSAQPSRDGPTVGGYRRGSRVRTTRAGTWFPAIGPDDEPAGLLLLHPAVKPAVLTETLARLAPLRLPGVLPVHAGLVAQAGRNWLVAASSITPTVADLLDDGPHRTPANAAAVLTEVAETLAEAHAAGLAHGAVGAQSVLLGPAGNALLADWGTTEDAEPDTDREAWAALAEVLAERWCADAPADAALLGRAAGDARQPGPDGGLDAALEWLDELAERADRSALVTAAATPVSAPRRRPADDVARRAALVEQEIDGSASPSGTPPPGPPRSLDGPPSPPLGPPSRPAEQPRSAAARPAGPEPVGPATGGPATGGPASGTARTEPSARQRERADPGPPPADRRSRPAAPPAPPDADPAPPARPTAPRGSLRRCATRPALLAAGMVVVLAAAAAVLLLPGPAEPAPSPPAYGPLQVRGVRLIAEERGSICVVTGSISTNGRPGRVVYRWIGQNGSQPLSTVSIGTDGQVEVGIAWSPGTSPVRGNTVALQVLEPAAGTSTAEIPLRCI